MSARIFGSKCITSSHLRVHENEYPVLRFGKKQSTQCTAARLVYRLFVGEVQHWQIVSLRCGNKACLNPTHMYLRTRAEAAADGAANRENRRLTRKDYWYIRRSPLSLKQLNTKFGYSIGGLGSIRRGEKGIEQFSIRYTLLVLWERAWRRSSQ